MRERKPDWLRIKIRGDRNTTDVRSILESLSLHTVCEEADCPNRMECFARKTATFMILGRICTRNCTFCNVENGVPSPPDPEEPANVALAVEKLGLRHAVITSVTRDDLSDGGASVFAETIREIRKSGTKTAIEVLIPDFRGDIDALYTVMEAAPDIINHNVETVPRLYPEVRPQADFQRSLELIGRVKKSGKRIMTKSGIMLGLGEKENEVKEVLSGLRNAGCEILTIGQYLAPSVRHHRVVEYIHPSVFEQYRNMAIEMGFTGVASAPLVRSSYMAENIYEKIRKNS